MKRFNPFSKGSLKFRKKIIGLLIFMVSVVVLFSGMKDQTFPYFSISIIAALIIVYLSEFLTEENDL